jgi:REP element-mobilizing transposase RayT
MSRPLRIEYPGAWYHIMNRGGRYEAIFKDKNDYSVFLELLREAIEIFHVNVSAFCLMQHHYHLLIQTPGANISRSMRHLRSDTLSTICKEFGLKKDSPAGSIFDRAKKQILRDKQFRNKVAGIKKIINKS